MKTPALIWFKDIKFADVAVVGGKGANLGEMYSLGIPVPNGFVVTAKTYFDFIDTNSLKPQIKNILDSANVDHPDELLTASKKSKPLSKSPDSR